VHANYQTDHEACPGFLECRILLLHDVIANFNKVIELNSIYMAAQHQLLRIIVIITEYIIISNDACLKITE